MTLLTVEGIFIHFHSLFGEYSDYIEFTFAFIEIFRRFIWNFFRLENKHVYNCKQFPATRDISIRPTVLLSCDVSFSQTANTNFITTTITSDIPLTRINQQKGLTQESILRKKTNAEEFFDEMNTILNIQSPDDTNF